MIVFVAVMLRYRIRIRIKVNKVFRMEGKLVCFDLHY